MFDEKVYVTDDGSEYILGERCIIKDKRFLLLYEEKSDDVFVATEEQGKLVFLDESYPGYNEVFSILFEKFKNRS